MANENHIDEYSLPHAFGDAEAGVLGELKAAAFEVLLLHPGCGYGGWAQELMRNYRAEVSDCYGDDDAKACAALRGLWEGGYDDEASGLCMGFGEWARALATEESRSVYYALVEAKQGAQGAYVLPEIH